MKLADDSNVRFGSAALTITWPDPSCDHLNAVLFDDFDVETLLKEGPRFVNRLMDEHGLPKWSDYMRITLYAVKAAATHKQGAGSLIVVSLSRAPEEEIQARLAYRT